MRLDDTIFALSSGAPPSGVAVIRLSGPATSSVLADIAGGVPEARRLALRAIRIEGAIIDQGLVAFFPSPHSFTGEDCAELQVHGSPAGLRAILAGLGRLPGLRLAEAGEFTRRAFENGKLDATAIEGLGDLLAAETESQRRQALERLQGGLAAPIALWRETLLDLRAEIEARLDFSDEGDVAGDLPPHFSVDLQRLSTEIGQSLKSFESGRLVREGVRIALAGPPNAGKSSLLNALARSDVAIVTAEAGTTRDVREQAVDLGGHLALIVDMAGLRETDSLAEAEGVRRARGELERADLVLWLVAPDVPSAEAAPAGKLVWTIATKADLGARAADMAISVHSGAGLEALLARLTAFVAGLTRDGEVSLVSRERDRLCLEAALEALAAAQASLDRPELAAESLRLAGHALERLVGRIDSEAVLDRLFAGFCIGK